MKLFSDTNKKIRLATLIAVVVLSIAILCTLLAAWVYLFPSTRGGEKLGQIIPFPVARVGWQWITTKDVAENMSAIRRFYESQDFERVGMRVDFATPEGQKRLKLREKDLVNKMIEDVAIARLAREEGIVVTPDTARRGVEDKVKELGVGSTVESNLARLYGWTLSDFSEKVVRPSLYEEALLAKFQAEDRGKVTAKEKIEEASAKLKSGTSFADVANELSEGSTAANGGDLGWFSIEDLAPDLQKPVEGAKRGTPTDIVESSLGYHILLLEESKLEDGKRLYHLRQIFTRKPAFADWLTEKMRTMPITVYSRVYRWNQETAEVEFRDRGLIEFEKDLLEKAEGDPSLLL